ncbi:unnamed protein product [Mytilus coruscus]|uniref:Mab-21-like nucleotidyltransferase domain-containing protein n=1 Tax=Mytilus coruscus TaxID=42192 RepID=A0A6J7ZVN0_MYTCO|nr:unnamed protein product [Mytilus coruscus]
MSIDRRGQLRGKCSIQLCDCVEYELPVEGHNCSYCGDPPARHQLIIEPEIAESNNNAEKCKDLNEVPASSMIPRCRPWENTAFGWINGPTRPSGVYYNSILPNFYQSFWPYYPDPKQFKKAFIMERSRQYNINTQTESISKKIQYMLSDNPACVGKFMTSDDYTPKPGDRAIIKLNRDNTEDLKVLVERVESDVNTHDSSLFINSGRKLKSGRDCHHSFNNFIKNELSTLKTRLLDLNNNLDKLIMNTNHSNQEIDDGDNIYGMRKITFLEKYGVKRFPYRGRRKYTPLVYQSVDGGMMISNDVFGLTIRQFERLFKDCLERRKTKEQWILNLRYPDKSSNEYLEYLQNCTDCDKEYLTLAENYSTEKDLLKYLIRTVGTEIDIRNRQRLFIILDMIHKVDTPNLNKISSGSLAEGLDLPGSDLDVMYVTNEVYGDIENVRNIKLKEQSTILVMETSIEHPGFTRLRFIARGETEIEFVTNTGKDLYFSVNDFFNTVKPIFGNLQLSQHGPCLSDPNQTFDLAFCLRSKYLPNNVIPWAMRHRQQWPPNFVIDKIKKSGCLLVPIGPKIGMLGSYMAPIYSRFYEVLTFIESLLMYEQSAFIIGVCNHYKAKISQFAAQIRSLPTTVNKEYYMHKRYHRHLQDGTKTDAVSGWLLYASYYYVTGQHKATLELIDYVLSRCTPDMIPINCNDYNECDAYYYSKNVHSTLTLIERMKIAAEESVCYMQHSSLIPGELQLEVQDGEIYIPVIVMSHSLRFLCFHHLGDRSNKKQALRDLHLTLEYQHNIQVGKLSESFTIIGVCNEISGDKDKAFQLYDKALQCVGWVCVTAEKRKSKLLEI